MYQEDFHLSHYWQFSPKLPKNGQSLRFPPIRKVDLRGWPLNSENGKSLLFSNIPNDVSEWRRTEVAPRWLANRTYCQSSKVIHAGQLCSTHLEIPDREKEGIDREKRQFYKLFHCTMGPMIEVDISSPYSVKKISVYHPSSARLNNPVSVPRGQKLNRVTSIIYWSQPIWTRWGYGRFNELFLQSFN